MDRAFLFCLLLCRLDSGNSCSVPIVLWLPLTVATFLTLALLQGIRSSEQKFPRQRWPNHTAG